MSYFMVTSTSDLQRLGDRLGDDHVQEVLLSQWESGEIEPSDGALRVTMAGSSSPDHAQACFAHRARYRRRDEYRSSTRRQRREETFGAPPDACCCDPATVVIDLGEIGELLAAIAPDKRRLWLAKQAGVPVGDIAAAVGKTAGAMRTMLSRIGTELRAAAASTSTDGAS